MPPTEATLIEYLLCRLRDVLEDVGLESPEPITPSVRISDVLDSMAFVELLEDVAEDCQCPVTTIEACVDFQSGTIAQFARAMHRASLSPRDRPAEREVGRDLSDHVRRPIKRGKLAADVTAPIWLAGSDVRLPARVQSADEMNRAVGRPAGWLERRAGIVERRVWGAEDPIEGAAECVASALAAAGITPRELAAVLVVSEAPPLPVAWGAAIHERLGLPAHVPCFELGGACTGFLLALSLSRSMLMCGDPVALVAVESHSRVLPLVPGPQGESAALFGDGAAAIVLSLSNSQTNKPSVQLVDLFTYTDGGARDLIRVQPSYGPGYSLQMDGVPLTEFALHALSSAVREMATKHQIALTSLSAIVAHGGNGRMPPMLARLLHLPSTKLWSDVKTTGNLGSASVPGAWSSRDVPESGPVIWTAVGAGLMWGAALFQVERPQLP